MVPLITTEANSILPAAAYHEAGHAVMAVHLDLYPGCVTMHPGRTCVRCPYEHGIDRTDLVGAVRLAVDSPTMEQLRKLAAAGPWAEFLYHARRRGGEDEHLWQLLAHSRDDFIELRKLLPPCDRTMDAKRREMHWIAPVWDMVDVASTMREHWPEVVRMAERLQQDPHCITSSETQEVMAAG